MQCFRLKHRFIKENIVSVRNFLKGLYMIWVKFGHHNLRPFQTQIIYSPFIIEAIIIYNLNTSNFFVCWILLFILTTADCSSFLRLLWNTCMCHSCSYHCTLNWVCLPVHCGRNIECGGQVPPLMVCLKQSTGQGPHSSQPDIYQRLSSVLTRQTEHHAVYEVLN